MTHHPHVHMIVPGGGISLDGTRWVRCKPGFLLPVRVLSRLFRRLFLAALADAHAAGRLAFFGEIQNLHRREVFAAHLAPLKRKKWFVYSKPPFAGPEAVLAYLARYTHRVAIANSRLLALDVRGVTFRYKDYRRNGQARYCTMTLSAEEFIRRFLLHVLPKGFHRIRHYGLLASAGCKTNISRARQLMAAPMPAVGPPMRGSGCDQMTILVLSRRHPFAGTFRFRRCTRFALPPASANRASLTSPQSGRRARQQRSIRSHNRPSALGDPRKTIHGYSRSYVKSP